MHASRALILTTTFAVTAAVPMTMLVAEGDAEDVGPSSPMLTVLSLPGRAGQPCGVRVFADAGCASTRAPKHSDALLDSYERELTRLREALVVAAEEIDRLSAELDARDSELDERDELWEARMERDRLEDDLHVMLLQEFPDIVAMEDPLADDSVEDEVVSLLMDVAAWLGPETIEVDEVEIPGPRRVTLADVRDVVSNAAVHRVAQRLPWWNLQLALTPYPGTWYSSDGNVTRSGSTLLLTREIDGEVVTVQNVELEHEDPRIEAARCAHARIAERRARDLEMLMGLPAGVLE